MTGATARGQVLRHGDRCYATGTGATPRGQVLRHGDRCYATGTGATPRGQVLRHGDREKSKLSISYLLPITYYLFPN
ncbi:hypothetical protein [Dolichospermum flos-aquae]|uniref:Uncharacterized protein n=1 Tax=Dolichospermum flos-aquae LEGE 04289 TaxID=1828708 RepID=A0ACC5Q5V3_DOLFA|nr:hypothetical protein [Dolichospermum flos-aquae]MBE9220566.1 hypothetical protein [Dolichospermum flos-aquae LEGE 04289]